MKRLTLLLILPFILLQHGCWYDTESRQSIEQEKIQKEAHAQIGMPAIKNFQERKLLKMIYELRDQEKLICYAYLFSMDGKLHYLGRCLGFGIPYSTQFTNPMKSEYSSYTIPQADPNGLYAPQSADGTWILLLDNKGEPHPVFIEPHVIVSPFKLNV